MIRMLSVVAVLSILAYCGVALAEPQCTFGGSVHGQCTTIGGRDCYTFRFVVHGDDCQVDLYRTKTLGGAGWELVALDIQDEYSDCPDWSKGPYDYKLVAHCPTCPSGESAYLSGISCP